VLTRGLLGKSQVADAPRTLPIKHSAMNTENPIRVLHIITRMIVGGAQENTLLSVEGLDQLPDYEVTLLSGVDNGPEGDLLERARNTTKLLIVPELGRSINPLSDIIAFWKLYKLIRRGRYHVVHTHSSKAGVLGRIAAKLAGTPIIVHIAQSGLSRVSTLARESNVVVDEEDLCSAHRSFHQRFQRYQPKSFSRRYWLRRAVHHNL
jgi:hypothetical protein